MAARGHHWGIAVITLSVDERIQQVAAGQMGLVTRAQLRACGIAASVIDRRLRAKRLHQLHRGVYRLGPLGDTRARELAAVLACGPHAVLSHRSAGALWQLLPAAEESAPIDVSVRQGNRGRRPKIWVHRVSLAADDVTTLEGIPITSVRRTLLDLAGVLCGPDMECVLAQAERLQHADQHTLQSLADDNAGRPGARLLRALLQKRSGTG
jgi:putative AbiEi antitoxin of type IV toxin-antitoxin system